MVRLLKAFALFSLLAFPSCATMIRGTSEDLQINSQPEKARAELSNGMSCDTPCKFKLKRNQSLTIRFKKEGCQDSLVSVFPTLSGSGVLLGGLIDFGTGAVYDLQPNPVLGNLSCGQEAQKQGTQPQPVIKAQLSMGDTKEQVIAKGVQPLYSGCVKQKMIDKQQFDLWDFTTSTCHTSTVNGYVLIFRDNLLTEIRQVKNMSDLDL